jgi:hypothetical protein
MVTGPWRGGGPSRGCVGRSRARGTLGLLLGALVAPWLMACSDDSAGTGPKAGDGVIEGVVARQKTGVGVPGVVLAASVGGAVVATTHTDGEGAFAFKDLASGQYSIAVTGMELAGLDPLFDALEPEAQSVDLGSDPVDLVFAVVSLVPARITGEVVCDGAPVANARIRVVGGVSDVFATSNTQGKYAALDLYPGSYAVIPESVPCSVEPIYEVVTLRKGELREVDFQG